MVSWDKTLNVSVVSKEVAMLHEPKTKGRKVSQGPVVYYFI